MVLEAVTGDSDAAADRLPEVGEIVLAAPVDDRVSALRLSGLGDALGTIAQLSDGIALVMRTRETLDVLFAADEELVAFGHELVINALLTAGDTRLQNGASAEAAAQFLLRPVVRDILEAKVYRAVYTNRQLEDVLTDFWFNHFNVYLDKGQDRVYVGPIRARRHPPPRSRQVSRPARGDGNASRDAFLSG